LVLRGKKVGARTTVYSESGDIVSAPDEHNGPITVPQWLVYQLEVYDNGGDDMLPKFESKVVEEVGQDSSEPFQFGDASGHIRQEVLAAWETSIHGGQAIEVMFVIIHAVYLLFEGKEEKWRELLKRP
jgi:hypothetical protein